MKPIDRTRPSQRGATLIISLLILAVLTLIGVTAVQSTLLEEKMAGNMRDQNMAFQAAEAGLRGGEDWMGQQPDEPEPQTSCTSSPCEMVWQLNAPKGGDFMDIIWWKTTDEVRAYDDVRTGTETALSKIKTPPKFLVEYHSFIKDSLVVGQHSDEVGRHAYRVTARGTGGTDEAQAILQTTYTRRF